MTAHQEALVAKAHRALASARLALDSGDAEASTNRAYYACFYMAQAALVGVGEEPKTHSGIHNRFAFHFVLDGAIPSDIARTLPHAAQVRERTDYDAFSVTDLGAAADLLADAVQFVEAVYKLWRSSS